MYLEKFKRAIVESEKRWLKIPSNIIFEKNKKYLTPEIMKPLELLLNTEAYYTISYVNINSHNFFKINYETIDKSKFKL